MSTGAAARSYRGELVTGQSKLDYDKRERAHLSLGRLAEPNIVVNYDGRKRFFLPALTKE